MNHSPFFFSEEMSNLSAFSLPFSALFPELPEAQE
jgi:hypothetical protein